MKLNSNLLNNKVKGLLSGFAAVFNALLFALDSKPLLLRSRRAISPNLIIVMVIIIIFAVAVVIAYVVLTPSPGPSVTTIYP